MTNLKISKADLDAAIGFRDLISAAASKYNIEPAIIAGVGSRESGWGTGSDMKPSGPGGTGDWTPRKPKPGIRGSMPPDGKGYGRGLLQADWDWSDFARGSDWSDPEKNIDFGCNELAGNIRGFEAKGLNSADSIRAGLAAYNHGFGRVWADYQSGGINAVDAGTAGHNYSADVLARADFFRKNGFANGPAVYELDVHQSAADIGSASNFYQDVIAHDSRFHSTDPVKDPALLEPVTRAAVNAIIADAKALGITLMIVETYRSRERQQALFDQGATQLKDVGVHHYGLACDLAKNIDGQPSWKGDFSFLRDLAKHHGLIWGGDWGQPNIPHSFRDDDHVQRVTKARQPSLFRGEWYPNASYNPFEDGAS